LQENSEGEGGRKVEGVGVMKVAEVKSGGVRPLKMYGRIDICGGLFFLPFG
jgi:hypothetical protein